MNFEFIQDKTIIICEENYKNKILEYLNENNLFQDIKFYSKKSFIENYYYSYSKECLPYLLNKYHLKIDILENYLNKLYYIDDKEYQSSKLKFLKELKDDLIKNNYLIYNSYFKDSINNYQIVVLGYPYLDNLEIKIFKEINAKITKDEPKYNISKVYEFNNIDSEINFVCEKIIELLNNKIDINHIKLMNVTKEYYNGLRRISNLYHLPINIPTNNNLYNNIIGKTFLNNLYHGIKYSINLIKDEDEEIVNKIVNLCNKFNYVKDLDILKTILIKEFKNTKINNFQYQNYVEIIDTFALVNDDDYVFLMNFTTSSIPSFIKDEDYFTDNIKEELNLSSCHVINKEIKNATINKLKSIKNLVISYKLKDNKTIYYPSILVNELNLMKEHYQNESLVHYSLDYDKLKLAKMIYDYETYGIISDEYNILRNSLKDISYNSYNNEYTKIDKDAFKEYINNRLSLSYSQMNNYNKCAFRYYLSNVLKLQKEMDLFESFIGSLLHDCLSKCVGTNLDSDEVIDSYIQTSGRVLSKKEEYFVKLMKEDIKNTLKIIKDQNININLDKTLKEQKIQVDKSRDIDIKFVGFIDKILYKELENKTIISLVDYKSGKEDIDLKYSEYGFNLQLPIYLYLVKNSTLFKNPTFAGFYLQFILDKNINKSNKSYEEELKDRLKLEGYSNSDENILTYLDSNYQNSNLIKGLKCKNNGEFYKNSKVLSNEEMDNLINIVDNKIEDAINNILDVNFKINPKKIGYKNDVGCKYCKFQDICFKKDRDYVILKEIEGEEDVGLD